MYNPLEELTTDALVKLIMSGYKFFVRQSYPRGMVSGAKEAFLITPYKTLEEANTHYIELKYDRRKYVYNIDDSTGDHLSADNDRGKLFIAAKQPAGFRVYYDRMRHHGDEWFPPRPLMIQMNEFIKRQGLAHSNNKIDARIGLRFGKLIVKFISQKHKYSEEISLDDLEKY